MTYGDHQPGPGEQPPQQPVDPFAPQQPFVPPEPAGPPQHPGPPVPPYVQPPAPDPVSGAPGPPYGTPPAAPVSGSPQPPYQPPTSGPPQSYGPPASGSPYGPSGYPAGPGPTGPVFRSPAPEPAADPLAGSGSPLYFPPRPPEKSRTWLKVVAGVGAVVVLAALLVGSYLLVKDTGNKPNAAPSRSHSPSAKPSPTRSPLDISSRTADSKALTADEVFPATSIRADPGRSTSYPVLKKDVPITSCPAAANGEVGAVLTKYSCTQVVRATLASADNKYVFTAGICNMADAAGAQNAMDQITQLGKAGRGGFSGMAVAGSGAAKLDQSPTLYAVQAYGHYLMYIVIGLPAGTAPTANADTQQITQDFVVTYLVGVIDKRKNNG